MATNTKPANVIHEEWDLTTTYYLDAFNGVSHADAVASRMSGFAQAVPKAKAARTTSTPIQGRTNSSTQGPQPVAPTRIPEPDASAVEAVLQAEYPNFLDVVDAMDGASGSWITNNKLINTTKMPSSVTAREGIFINLHKGSRFNLFEGGTNLTNTIGPTVNYYAGSRAVWQRGERFYQKLNVKNYMNDVVASDRYESSILAAGDAKIKTVAGKRLYTVKEAVAAQNLNVIYTNTSTLDVAGTKSDFSATGISAVLQASVLKTEVKAGVYACDMKVWLKMDEFRIGVIGYTLWDIGKFSVKNSVTAMAMNNYMGVFCSFANKKVDVKAEEIDLKGTVLVKAGADISKKLFQVRDVTNEIKKSMVEVYDKNVEISKKKICHEEIGVGIKKQEISHGTGNFSATQIATLVQSHDINILT